MALTTSSELTNLNDTLVAVSFGCFALAALVSLLQLTLQRIGGSSSEAATEATVESFTLNNGAEKVAVVEDAKTTSPVRMNGTSPDTTLESIPEQSFQSFADMSMLSVSFADTTQSSADELLLRPAGPINSSSSYREMQKRKSWLELRKSVLLRQASKLETELEEIGEQVRELRLERERMRKAMNASGRELKELRDSWEELPRNGKPQA
ncbi:hypothetical protein CALVIDRAFT_537553 [Calocera viscosa TUFC12733]|uniref:Uncharacterized protein n=1 Tax=Calocera viscosa (strain TUFC12733) TaxID=1330018 RepID=A0A167LRX9_CALVF|nr:hypothetical protein CALVIDRAFT_537553 [Calocera viscosa TUFC12733]